eukprot:1256409-Pyramimonas_sp.AAC.1
MTRRIFWQTFRAQEPGAEQSKASEIAAVRSCQSLPTSSRAPVSSYAQISGRPAAWATICLQAPRSSPTSQ